MISLSIIREHPDIVMDGIKNKGSEVTVSEIIDLDEKDRELAGWICEMYMNAMFESYYYHFFSCSISYSLNFLLSKAIHSPPRSYRAQKHLPHNAHDWPRKAHVSL